MTREDDEGPERRLERMVRRAAGLPGDDAATAARVLARARAGDSGAGRRAGLTPLLAVAGLVALLVALPIGIARLPGDPADQALALAFGDGAALLPVGLPTGLPGQLPGRLP